MIFWYAVIFLERKPLTEPFERIQTSHRMKIQFYSYCVVKSLIMVLLKAKFILRVWFYAPSSFFETHSQLKFFSFISFYMCWQALK